MESKLKVKLLANTPNPDLIVASAAKLCYSQVGVDEIQEKLNNDEVERFVNMLVNINHESPLEHVNFTFAVEGISRSCSHQIVRHRIASFSQQSQRYVKLEQFEYIIPPEIKAIPQAKEIFIKAMEEDQKSYDQLVDILYKKHYLDLINKGKSEKIAKRDAEKKAIEDARYVFPNSCETKMVFTMNARSLMNFLHHRCCERAQWECDTFAYNVA